MQDVNLVSKLKPKDRTRRKFALKCISPDDAKYGEKSQKLVPYLSAEAEWIECTNLQRTCLETRVEFSQAQQENLDELDAALKKIDSLNITLLEEDKRINHDQLAVIEEIGRFVSLETKALLHPGTTSYDIVDTARSYLFKKAWTDVIRPEVNNSIEKLCELAEKSIDILQVGRTHLQDTSPVLFGGFLANYAARLAERVDKCNFYFNDLRGKISGIVGTGASIDMVIGEGKSLEFEKVVLDKLGLKPDYTATQIVPKERLADVGHGLTTLVDVLYDFADNIRKLYSSAIKEVTSRDNAERLGGSSADAMKNNPVQWENICGTAPIVEAGMRILYSMIQTDFQRDLVGSKPARYQPQAMMAETYETFSRLNKALGQLSINEDKIAENLIPVRNNPSEAMVAILRGEKWIHTIYGAGHDFVKEMGKIAKKGEQPLIEVALNDAEFVDLYNSLSENKRTILNGELERYTGSAKERAKININYARSIIKS